MSLRSEKTEIHDVINRLLDNLASTVTSQTGRSGAELRGSIGNIRANYSAMMLDGTFANNLLACFTTAWTANVSLASLTIVHNGLFAEEPVGEVTTAVVQMAIIFCLSAESRIITNMDFTSRDDVDAMIKKMKTVFDTARFAVADLEDASAYQKLTALAGALTNHLANVSRPLPRMMTFNLWQSLPALTVSQRIYYTASRWEEIINENKTIHPAFVQREIVGLSS